MEVVLHHVVVEKNIEQDTLTVITMDNNVVVGLKVHHVIHKDVVIQHMEMVDTGQDVVHHVIQELKTTIVTDTVTTMVNTVEQNIGIGQVVTLIHATHATFNTIVM